MFMKKRKKGVVIVNVYGFNYSVRQEKAQYYVL